MFLLQNVVCILQEKIWRFCESNMTITYYTAQCIRFPVEIFYSVISVSGQVDVSCAASNFQHG